MQRLLKVFYPIRSKRKKVEAEMQRLLKAFPKALHTDVQVVLAMLLKCEEVPKRKDLMHASTYEVMLGGEHLIIPYRLWFDEPKEALEKTLTARQKNILNCIYTRHSNGYVREQRLGNITGEIESWMLPFLVQIIGEYVYELLPLIDKTINEKTLSLYASFVEENFKYWRLTQKRMVSYWNEYYRYRFPKIRKYLGTKMVRKINNYSLSN